MGERLFAYNICAFTVDAEGNKNYTTQVVIAANATAAVEACEKMGRTVSSFDLLGDGEAVLIVK